MTAAKHKSSKHASSKHKRKARAVARDCHQSRVARNLSNSAGQMAATAGAIIRSARASCCCDRDAPNRNVAPRARTPAARWGANAWR